jgi:DNA repair protein RadC
LETVKGIKSWSEEDRPREKLAEKGGAALTDAELLAILLGSGSRHESAVELARRILASVNNDLVALGSLSHTDLKKFKGMGQAKSVSVIAALELARRRRATEAKKNKPQITPRLAYEMMLQHMENLHHEEFWLIGLNRKMQALGVRKLSEGGMAATVVDPKKVFKAALDMNAGCIIVAHNHPSGNPTPSREDDNITKKLREAGQMMDCHLCDHIIVTTHTYYSYADEGKLSLI